MCESAQGLSKSYFLLAIFPMPQMIFMRIINACKKNAAYDNYYYEDSNNYDIGTVLEQAL